MEFLHKVFVKNHHTQFARVFNERQNYETTVQTRLKIKPFNQPNTFSLYYIPTNSMLSKVSEIYQFDRKLGRIFDNLPPVARKNFINQCLVEELYNTNQLEGVKSTKEEIAQSAKNLKSKNGKKERFDSMYESYLRITNDNFDLLNTPEDIRAIYDEIVSSEIEKEELPDGEIFREEPTYVKKKSGTEEVIHRGTIPESSIVQEIEQFISFLNEEDISIPTIIKVAIAHYYFGYVHPFYDGNGRTSRFISSMYLATALTNISSLSVSRGSNKLQNDYYKAFEVTNSIRSRGELNYFIDFFLSMMLSTLEEMLIELKEKDELMHLANERISNEEKLEGKGKIYESLMFVLSQNFFFTSSPGMSIKELSGILDISPGKTRKLTEELLSLNLIKKEGIRPAYYSIADEYFE